MPTGPAKLPHQLPFSSVDFFEHRDTDKPLRNQKESHMILVSLKNFYLSIQLAPANHQCHEILGLESNEKLNTLSKLFPQLVVRGTKIVLKSFIHFK